MVFKRAYLFPILVFIWFPITFTITYIAAVTKKHVPPFFPYISDTGTWAPESCFFGIMVTIGALFMLATVYVRYRQIKHACEKNDFGTRTQVFNNVSLLIACISVLGMLMVANFQETNSFIVHIIGAQLCFVGAVLWQLFQVFISFKVYPALGTRVINILRVICTLLCISCFLLSGAFGIAAYSSFRGKDFTKWTKDDGGYEFHIISTATEWLMTIFLGLYIVTFTREYRLIHFKEPEIVFDEVQS